MISPTSFTIESIQAVAYVAGDGLRPSAVLRHVLQHYGDVYDGEPIAVPYVDGMPPEVPTAILPSQDGAWRADISRMSLSLLWNRTPDSTVGNLHRTYHSFAERLGSIFDMTQSRVGRLGAVIIRSAPVSDPGKALAEQFCRDEWLHGPLNRPEGLELHAHKVFQIRARNSRAAHWAAVQTSWERWQYEREKRDSARATPGGTIGRPARGLGFVRRTSTI